MGHHLPRTTAPNLSITIARPGKFSFDPHDEEENRAILRERAMEFILPLYADSRIKLSINGRWPEDIPYGVSGFTGRPYSSTA